MATSEQLNGQHLVRLAGFRVGFSKPGEHHELRIRGGGRVGGGEGGWGGAEGVGGGLTHPVESHCQAMCQRSGHIGPRVHC